MKCRSRLLKNWINWKKSSAYASSSSFFFLDTIKSFSELLLLTFRFSDFARAFEDTVSSFLLKMFDVVLTLKRDAQRLLGT